MDISGAFNNFQWETLMEDMREVRISEATASIIKSYLKDREAMLTVVGSTAGIRLTKRCLQGSQLGPTLWNIAMDKALKGGRKDWVKMVAYADDLVVLVAGAKIETIRMRARGYMDRLMDWARNRGHSFSAEKTKVISLKEGLKLGSYFNIGDDRVIASSPVKYLEILLDYKRNFWEQVRSVAGKSGDLYSRLRGASSADWGMGQKASEIVYGAVFLPRVENASEIWVKGVRTAKGIKVLENAQRRPLLAITKAYRTTSTDALQTVAGRLPLDLEVEMGVLRKRLRKGEISAEEMRVGREGLLDRWQARWDNSEKGRWTHRIFPDVRYRVGIAMELN